MVIGPSLDDFRIQRNLGNGAYATVKLATHEKTKKRVALKLYPLEKLTKVKMKAVQQETVCMKLLNSNYFPRLYADFETEKGERCLVQEFVSGQSLYQVIKQRGQKQGLSEDVAKYYFK